MVSMGSKQLARIPGNGPFVFRVHGQVYHDTSAVTAEIGKTPSYSQLYILDTEKANAIRDVHPANSDCDRDLMRQLVADIRKCHKYAKSFVAMGELMAKEDLDHVAENRPRMAVEMAIYNDRTKDKRRYNVPHGNEVAIVFSSPDGIPPADRDIVGHLRIPESGRGLIRIKTHNAICDPMTYPILHPRGESAFAPNLVNQHSL